MSYPKARKRDFFSEEIVVKILHYTVRGPNGCKAPCGAHGGSDMTRFEGFCFLTKKRVFTRTISFLKVPALPVKVGQFYSFHCVKPFYHKNIV